MSSATQATDPSSLDVGEIARASWETFTQAPLFHVVAGLIFTVVSSISGGLLMGPLLVGYIRAVRAQSNGDVPRVGNLSEGFSNFVPAFVGWFIPTLGIAVGSALIVLPGLVLAFLWTFTLWFVALKDMDPLTAMGASWRLAKSHVGSMLLVLLAILAVNLLGSIFVIGILFTVPLGVIALTLTFEELDA